MVSLMSALCQKRTFDATAQFTNAEFRRHSSNRANELFGAKQLNRVGPKSNCTVRYRGPNLDCQLTAKKRLKKRHR